jgi:hypothetical protein
VNPLLQLYKEAGAVAARVEQQQRDARSPIDAAAAMSIFFREVDPVRLSSSLTALKGIYSLRCPVVVIFRSHRSKAVPWPLQPPSVCTSRVQSH